MKVILAGFPKTGTKSIASALRILDYNVFDYMEHFWYHRMEWDKILTSGGPVDDFRRMYENVDAVTASPVYFFWEQIHQAFPDALIIFTMRDDESWMKSLEKQWNNLSSDIYLKLIFALSPFGWSFRQHLNKFKTAVMGSPLPHAWSRFVINHMMMLNRYKIHNEYLLKHAPKDKLLVFDLRDGWEPLCKFLGKEVPDVPFPHKNAGGSFVKMMLKENAIMQRLWRHTMVAGVLWLGVGSITMFLIGRSITRCGLFWFQ